MLALQSPHKAELTVSVYLIDRLMDVHARAFLLDLDQWETVAEQGYVIS